MALYNCAIEALHESSATGMAPATLLTPGAAVVDLDGPLLLREDRDHGLDFTDGMIHPPKATLWG